MKIMMMKVRKRQEEDEVEEGRDGGSRGGTREDCERCDRGQTERESRDSPPDFCCLFQLTPQTPKQTHTPRITHWLSAANWCQFIFFCLWLPGTATFLMGKFQADAKQQQMQFSLRQKNRNSGFLFTSQHIIKDRQVEDEWKTLGF